ncbi:hypothetical protein JYB85_15145 [Shewanella sedimentimangrovi]|uniref:Uncharacterized protein n=2 Tax=Shewanella sedimentimangrovi TaxID=2814293 RepID=A0ABX7R178_9GAMM|nr:hypothetical protein JYB85_15145 [Shewanella sedimentimangrovi]
MNSLSIEKSLKKQKLLNAMLALGLLAVTGKNLYSATQVAEFDEISVKRINVLEEDGQLRMVMANSERSPQAIKEGKVYMNVGKRPGLIFYNDEGTENGGLMFRGKKEDGKVNHGLHMSFDRYNQDQTMALQHIESEDYMITGMTILDRPDSDMFSLAPLEEAAQRGDEQAKQQLAELNADGKLYGVQRAFYGTLNGDAQLRLNDAEGNIRIRMVVDKLGVARLEFLNTKGEVVQRLPDDKQGK